MSAARVAAALARRSRADAVAAVTSWDLVHARRWSHTIDEGGHATGEVLTATGARLHAGELRGVVCRLRGLGGTPFRAPADQEYAAIELHALVLSWLAGLPCRVINPPAPGALAGPDPGPLGWLTLAARAGLRTRAACVTSDPCAAWPGEPVVAEGWTALVIGDRVLGSPPPEGAAACVALARLAGCEVLALAFSTAFGDAPAFIGADSCPQLDATAADVVAASLVG
jgi:hypothetical protein